MTLRRLPDEDPQKLADPAYRRRLILQNMGDEELAIAQEVEKVLPELVNTLSDGHTALDPLEVLGLLLAANKELLARVETLEERLSG